MALTLRWLRLEVRRRWRSLLVLTLLIAFAAGTVLTAVAGARRGASAADRLLAVTLPAQFGVVPEEPGFDWDLVRAMPEVEAVAPVLAGGFAIEGIPAADDAAWGPPADGQVLTTVERPVVLDGRLPDPSRADEAVVTSRFEESYGVGVGDTVTIRLYTPESMDAVNAGDLAIEPDGPRIPTRIVGVVRSFELTETPGSPGGLLPSPGLFAEYRANLLGATETGSLYSFVRLTDGEAGLADFKAGLAEITGRTDIVVWPYVEAHRQAQRTLAFEAAFLLAFGLAALAAAVFVVGQAVARYTAAAVADLQVLRSIGMTPRHVVVTAGCGPALCALVGASIGTSAAVVASRWMPLGAASAMEPAPGVDADWLVLGVGWLVTVASVVAGGTLAGWLAQAAARTHRPSAYRSSVARWAARWGLPLPIVVGTRLALEPGRGRNAVPVRPALVGAVVGVIGVMAAFTFAAGIAEAAGNPARAGQTHQLEAVFGFEGQDTVPSAEVLARWEQDPDVTGLTDCLVGVAVAEEIQRTLNVFAYDPVGQPVEIVLTGGRMPAGPSEVVLGPYTARILDARVGSVVRLGGPRDTTDYTVTGLGFVPEAENNYYQDGGWMTPDGYDRIFDGFTVHVAYVAVRPGADQEAVISRLAAAAALSDGGADLPVQRARQTVYDQEIEEVKALPVALAGFLAVLAAGAVGHALATGVRRRRHDLAVLRALGMTPGQCRGAVMTQATVLALAGLAIGVPLGVAIGRTLWRVVADYTPLAYEPPVAGIALAVVGPLTILVAVALATLPGRRAARLRVSRILRAE